MGPFFGPVLTFVLQRELAFCKGRAYFDSKDRFQDDAKSIAGKDYHGTKEEK
jgi:hypothetical protein